MKQFDPLEAYQAMTQRFLHRRDVLKDLSEEQEDEYLDELDELWKKLTPEQREQLKGAA